MSLLLEKGGIMERKNLLLTNRNFQDLNPLVAGEHRCRSGHSFGPAVRKYTLLHYVLSGKGTLYTKEGSYTVTAGQAFLILPGKVTTYTADEKDPWHYRWIGFDGVLSERFAQLPPVVSLQAELFSHLWQLGEESSVTEYRLASALFALYADLFEDKSHKNPHVSKVVDYIRSSYMQPIRVHQIAKELNLDRRYLSRLFKEHTGQSIQDYLVSVRMEEAKQLLQSGHSVNESARLAGYEDVSNFSKMFKNYHGYPPATMKHKGTL